MADAEVRARLIIEAKDEAAAAMSSAKTETDNLTGAVDKASKAASDSGKKWQGLTDSADALKVPLAGAALGLGAVYAAIQLTAGATVEYAAQVRDLGRAAGVGAEESSKLIQVADDAMVSYETLKTASKNLIKEGIQPTIQNMGLLADQYNAIQDPVEKSQFLLEKFGRAGLEMGKLLEEGSAGINASADAAERAGLVMDEKAVKAAREYEKAMDDLTDTFQGFKIQAGNFLIPWLSDAAHGFTALIDVVKAFSIVVRESTGIIDHETAVAEAAALAGDNMADTSDKAALSLANEAKAADEATAALHEKSQASLLSAGMSGKLQSASDAHFEAQQKNIQSTKEITSEIARLTAEQGKAKYSTDELAGFAYDLEKAQLAEQKAAIALGKAQSELQNNTDPSKYSDLSMAVKDAQLSYDGINKALQDAWTANDNAKNATVDNTEAINNYNIKLGEQEAAAKKATDELHKLNKEMVFQLASEGLDPTAALELARGMGILDEKSYFAAKSVEDLKKKFDLNKDGALDAKEAASGYLDKVKELADKINDLEDKHITIIADIEYPPEITTATSTKRGIGHAQGADFVVPPGYENDSYPMRVQTGERVQVTPAGQTGGGGKSVQIGTVSINNGMDEARFTSMLRRELSLGR